MKMSIIFLILFSLTLVVELKAQDEPQPEYIQNDAYPNEGGEPAYIQEPIENQEIERQQEQPSYQEQVDYNENVPVYQDHDNQN